MKKYLFIPLILICLFIQSCDKQRGDQNCTVQHPEWVKSAVIYEVNIRQYTPEGTFQAFESHLPRLKELGVDVLWLMPVYPISETNRKGTLGSYYAISDYQAVNPEFGSMDDFRHLVEKAHKQGFKVILDWVANHTGWDNRWIRDHPEWYVKDSLGNIVSPYDWTDVAKLNYENAGMREAMLDAMKFWVKEMDVDGFRCDVAYEVPTDFWNTARSALDKVKPVFMLAEAEKPELLEHAFDADYGWELLHLMNSVAKGEKNANDIYACLQKSDTAVCPGAIKMNFITNHDENSWSGTEYDRYGTGVNAFAVLVYTIRGMPLIYTGQEAGMNKRLEFFEKDTVPDWTQNETFAFYRQLNQLKHNSPVLWAGDEGAELKRFRTTADDKILAYSRRLNEQEVLVILNLSSDTIAFDFTVPLADESFTDFFSGEKITRLPREMTAWEYRVLVK